MKPPRTPGAQRNGFRSPRTPSTPQNPALTALQSGNLPKAEQLYRTLLERNPQDLDTRLNLGLTLQALGKQAEAATQFAAALTLQPNNPDTHLKLGNTLAAQGKLVEAGLHYEQSLALKPNNPHAHMNLGNVLQAMSRLDDAILCYDRALAADPTLADIYLNYGNVLFAQPNRARAKQMYHKALTLQPNFAAAHINLGRILEEENQLDAAVASYHKALALQPHNPAAHMNLGNALHKQGNPLLAIDHYHRALTLRPSYPEAHTNLGAALHSLGRLDDAIASHDRALALKPDYALAHMNRALALLLSGRLLEGWPAHEWRWRVPSFTSPNRNFTQPQWFGDQSGNHRGDQPGDQPGNQHGDHRAEPLQSLHGKRLLLHAEQGLGDSIQFLRYLPLVQSTGATILLELPRRLIRLAATLPGVDQLIPLGDPLPPFDLHCPLMSLPLAFATDLTTIPATIPYLSIPEPALTAARALPWPSHGLRVGLAWAGNPSQAKDRFRSIPFSTLTPLLQLADNATDNPSTHPPIHFFSLQLGAEADLAASPARITDLTRHGADLADAAAQIAQLDLVLSVDTSIAHLTGALGIPIWLLLSTEVDWRWLTHRDDSPWYPTARLFRQTTPGDWPSVLTRVTTALTTLAAQKQTPTS